MAGKRKRPGWDALLAEVDQGRIRHVLTDHPDRFMRQPRDLEEVMQIADDHDITLYGQANRHNLADPDDRLFLRIEVAHACRSSDDTSRDSMVDRAQEGRPHTGRRRHGYDKTGMEIIPEEAAIVREIFTRYLDSRHVAGIRVFRGEEITRRRVHCLAGRSAETPIWLGSSSSNVIVTGCASGARAGGRVSDLALDLVACRATSAVIKLAMAVIKPEIAPTIGAKAGATPDPRPAFLTVRGSSFSPVGSIFEAPTGVRPSQA
ncbi:recombinase family protein [Streptomyces sp. NPDC046727]|uniref:recombinase family protein n=1 Tax=Streptomyces sp. NPDC046727 TaxID=3155373 RepID=UPI00340BC52C